jgi:prophage antirepressor-like protein
MLIKFEELDIEVDENQLYEFLISNIDVAKGYGVQEKSLLRTRTRHKDELIEGKHFVYLDVQTNGGMQNKIFWTKKGVVRLGFFIKSERAKKFRDWAEDLILQKVESEFSQNLNLQKIRERAELLEISEKEFGIFERVFFKLGITRKEELAITSNRAVKKETGVDFLEIAEKKGLSTTEKYFTVTELCEIVRNGDFSEEAKKVVSTKNGEKPRPQNLNKLLEKEGFQFRENEIWKTTEKGQEFSDFVQNKSQYSEKTVFHTVWKKEILNELF